MQCFVRRKRDSDGLGDCLDYVLCRTDLRQADQEDPVGVVGGDVGGCLHAETCLAGAARGEDRQQPGFAEQSGGLRQLGLTTDKVGELLWEVVGGGIQRFQRWKTVWKTVDIELVDMFRPGEIFESVFAHVSNRHTLGKLILNQFPGGAGEDGLSAVGDSSESCRPIHR